MYSWPRTDSTSDITTTPPNKQCFERCGCGWCCAWLWLRWPASSTAWPLVRYACACIAVGAVTRARTTGHSRPRTDHAVFVKVWTTSNTRLEAHCSYSGLHHRSHTAPCRTESVLQIKTLLDLSQVVVSRSGLQMPCCEQAHSLRQSCACRKWVTGSDSSSIQRDYLALLSFRLDARSCADKPFFQSKHSPAAAMYTKIDSRHCLPWSMLRLFVDICKVCQRTYSPDNDDRSKFTRVKNRLLALTGCS